MLEETFDTTQTDRSGIRMKIKIQKKKQTATANPNAALSPSSISPKKCLFWSTMKPLGMKHDKTGITNRMRWLTQLWFNRIREKRMGLLGPRKKRGNMELVEKERDQSGEALSRALCCRSRSPIACMWKSCSRPLSHTQARTHSHAHARSSCDSFLPSWLLSFISPVAVNVSYAIGGRGFASSPLWKM